jgi:hypothetical protein
MPPRASRSSFYRLVPYEVGLAVPLESGFQIEGSIAQTRACRQTHRHYQCLRAHRAQSRPDGATYFSSRSADPSCPLTMRGLPAHGPFSPSHTQDCSWAVLWAEVMVTWPCTSTNSARKAAADMAKGPERRSMFLSSYVLQSRLEVPDHSRGKLLRKLSAAFSATGGCLGTPPSA